MIRYALKVNQPIGDFYLVSLPARVLQRMCFSRPYERLRQDPSGRVENSSWFQRVFVKRRANPIAEFLKTQDAALPGTFVLAANYTERGDFLVDDDDKFESKLCWKARPSNMVNQKHQGLLYELNIPDNPRTAMVVDGQHRLGGFEGQGDAVLSMEVPCAIYLDLPIPLQAYIFATINFNQKPVSKSLNYELFAFDINNESPNSWSPDKFAVFISRKLNADPDSPLLNHIKIGAVDYTENVKDHRKVAWKVSTATIVAGVMSLITIDPQGDRNEMNKQPVDERDRVVLRGFKCNDDEFPLRKFYIEKDDDLIYRIVLNYFAAMQSLFNSGKFRFELFHKTSGVTALFKVLQKLLGDIFKQKTIDLSSAMWIKLFTSQRKMVDFNDPFFYGSSSAHVGRIRDMLLMMAGKKHLEDFTGKDSHPDYEKFWNEAEPITNA